MKNEDSVLPKRITTKRKTRNSKNTYRVFTNLSPNKVLQLTQKYNEILKPESENTENKKLLKPANMISYKIKNNQIYKINCENSNSERGKPVLKPKPVLIKPLDLRSTIIINEKLDHLTKLKNLNQNDKVHNTDTKEIKENLKPLKISKYESSVHNISENLSKTYPGISAIKLLADKSTIQKSEITQRLTNTLDTKSDVPDQKLMIKTENFSKLIDKYKSNNFRDTTKFPETYSQIKHLKKTPSFTLRNSELNYRSVKTVIEIFEKRKSETLKNSFRICNTNENRKIFDTFKKYDTLDSKLTKLRNRHKLMLNSSTSNEVPEQSLNSMKPVVPEKVCTNLNIVSITSPTYESQKFTDVVTNSDTSKNIIDDIYPKNNDNSSDVGESDEKQNQTGVKCDLSETSNNANDSVENVAYESATSNVESKGNNYSCIETTVGPNNSFLWRTKSRESIRLPSYFIESIYEEIQPNNSEAKSLADKNEDVIYEDIKSQLQDTTDKEEEISAIYEEILGDTNKNVDKECLDSENLYDPIGNYRQDNLDSNNSEIEDRNLILPENSTSEEYETLSEDSNYEDLDYDKALPKLEQICNEVRISLNGSTNIANYEQIYESVSTDIKRSTDIQSDYKEYGKCLPNMGTVQDEESKTGKAGHYELRTYYNISTNQNEVGQRDCFPEEGTSLIENDYYMPQADPDYYNQNNSMSTREESHDITDYENIDDVTAFQDCVLSHNNSLYRKCGWNQFDTHNNENEIGSNNWVDINEENTDDVNILIIRSRHKHKKRNDWSNRVREQWNKNSADTNQNIDQETNTSHFYESLPSEDDTDSFDSDSENEFCEKNNQDDSGINMSSTQFLEPPGNSHTLTRLAESASKQMQKLKNNFSITKNDFTKSLSRITNKKTLKWRASSTHALHSKNLTLSKPNDTNDSEQVVEKHKRSSSLTALKDSENHVPLLHCESEEFEKSANRYLLPPETSTNNNDVYKNIEFKMDKSVITEKRKKNWLKLKRNEENSVNRSTFYLASNDADIITNK